MPDFQNPAAFLLLILVPLLFLLRKFGIFARPTLFSTVSDWNGKPFEWNNKVRNIASILSSIFGIIGYLFVVLAFSNPVVYHQERVYTSRGTDIMFVLDVSPSMAAVDINGERRIDAAKSSIKELVLSNSGVSFGIVSMAQEAYVTVPPTLDHDLLLNRLEDISIGSLGDGTALGIGLSTAIFHLKASTAPKKCIVLVTDGENNAGAIHPETASELAYSNNVTVYTLGVGTSGTVPIDYVDPETGKKYSGYLTSSYDSQSLRNIASTGGGRYFEIQSLSDLSLALSVINRNESVVQSYHSKTTGIHYYDRLIFLSFIFIILCWVIKRLYLQEYV